MNRWHAFSQLILARIREFYREPEVVFWVYGFPLILAIALGIAFSRSKPDPPAVDIQGHEEAIEVKELAKLLRDAGIKVAAIPEGEKCRQRLRTGKTALFVVSGDKALTYVYDDTRPEALLARHWVESLWVRHKTGRDLPPPVEKFEQEAGNRYIDFLVPGLMGMNLMGGGLFGIGFVLVDMRVRKLFKRFLATPMRRADFLLAILTARMIFMIPEMIAVLALGHFVFGVPIAGNPFTLILVIFMGTVAFAAMGLLLGCRTEKMETASGLINLIMLPMYLFSGVFFPSTRFPDEAQPFIQALPLTQVNDALREVMLEGMGLTDIAWRLGILALWTVIPMTLALKWFRWR